MQVDPLGSGHMEAIMVGGTLIGCIAAKMQGAQK